MGLLAREKRKKKIHKLVFSFLYLKEVKDINDISRSSFFQEDLTYRYPGDR